MRSLNVKELSFKIQEWIKEYVESAKSEGVVIGLSGGIDSSVTAALCVNALGNEKVIGVSLPCESLQEDIEDAEVLANQLELEFLKINLTSTYKEFIKNFPSKIHPTKLSLGNIKPRLRMTALYFIGQSKGNVLVAGTGNRTEIVIGYFTKYGDGGVDFEPIGDLYKCEVKELAKELGVPNNIINKPPSAGLWRGQTDEDEIGMTYDTLDEIIYRMDYGLTMDNLNSKKVEKVKKMIQSTQHKRERPSVFKIK
ncbi:MAG: NAD+ synthase [Promethearchaeati archaeon]